MALTFGAATSNRVNFGLMPATPEFCTWLAWHFPTTITSGRRLAGRTDGSTFDSSLAWVSSLVVLSDFATTDAVAFSTRTYTTSQWWFSTFVLNGTLAPPQIFAGDLVTPMTEDTYDGTETAGVGAKVDDSSVAWSVGNLQEATPINAYQGRIAWFARVNRAMLIGEAEEYRLEPWRLLNDPTCDLWVKFGKPLGAGTQWNRSPMGRGFNGVVTGAVQGDDPPLPISFAPPPKRERRRSLYIFAGATTYNQSLESSIVLGGTLARLASYLRTLSGGVTLVGSLVKQLSVSMASTIVLGAGLLKSFVVSLASSIVLNGSLSKAMIWARTLASSIVLNGTLSRVASYLRTLSGSIVLVGTQTKTLFFTLASSIVLNGALSRAYTAVRTLASSVVLNGALSTAGTFRRTLATSITLGGSLVKTIYVSLASSVILNGALVAIRTFLRTLSSSIVLGGSLSVKGLFSRTLSSGITLVASLTKRLSVSLASTVVLGAGLVKRLSVALSSSVVLGGTIIRQTTKSLSSSVILTGTLTAVASAVASLIAIIESWFEWLNPTHTVTNTILYSMVSQVPAYSVTNSPSRSMVSSLPTYTIEVA